MKTSMIVLILASTSAALYGLHYLIFGDATHIFFWSLTSLAFLPISALVLTLIINRLMSERERRTRLEKMNMVIGAFFIEVGNRLLGMIASWDPEVARIAELTDISPAWTAKQFDNLRHQTARHRFEVNPDAVNLVQVNEFLQEKRDFLLRLLENPNLLEYGAFTALLRATLHVAEELDYRPSLSGLPESDIKHLGGDLRRVYALLVRQWVDYVRLLQTTYPYLFSLAERANPLKADSSAVVES